MITTVLQMLVFLAAAFVFAWCVLRIDKRENPPQAKPEDAQQTIDFPESSETGERRGAAMSHA
jgi:hypothetical protein